MTERSSLMRHALSHGCPQQSCRGSANILICSYTSHIASSASGVKEPHSCVLDATTAVTGSKALLRVSEVQSDFDCVGSAVATLKHPLSAHRS